MVLPNHLRFNTLKTMNFRRYRMNEYHMLTLEQASSMTINELINKYNNAVETIWYYHQKIETLMEENDSIWAAYEEIADELYG